MYIIFIVWKAIKLTDPNNSLSYKNMQIYGSPKFI